MPAFIFLCAPLLPLAGAALVPREAATLSPVADGNIAHADAANATIPAVLRMTACSPSRLEDAAAAWAALSPHMGVELSADAECEGYLRRSWGERHASLFRNLSAWLGPLAGPIKSDLWRAARLYDSGGIYSDADVEPLVPLSAFLDDERIELLVPLGAPMGLFNGSLFNALIMARPNHPVLADTLARMLACTSRCSYTQWSGTRHMQDALLAYLRRDRLEPGDYEVAGGRIVRVLREVCESEREIATCHVESTSTPAVRVANSHAYRSARGC